MYLYCVDLYDYFYLVHILESEKLFIDERFKDANERWLEILVRKQPLFRDVNEYYGSYYYPKFKKEVDRLYQQHESINRPEQAGRTKRGGPAQDS